MLEAATFIETIQRRQGLKIACPERSPFVWATATRSSFAPLAKSGYGEYLLQVPTEKPQP